MKGGTSEAGSGFLRLFITGVSPVTMDDVTSGFNIGKNICLDPRFNEFLGFTESETQALLIYYQKKGLFPLDLKQSLKVMKDWYNHYRFAINAKQEIYNTDMVLYYIDQVIEQGQFPDNLIDQNVKIDYGKLRHLIVLDQKLNGNFSLLQEILEKGEVKANIANSFPLEKLTHPDNFCSLLYYFGLLTFGEKKKGITFLKIPNLTIKILLYGYLRDAYEDVNCFQVNVWKLSNLIHEMAYDGNWKEVFQFLANEVEKQTSIRDYLEGERVVQTFIMAYLNVADYFVGRSEVELNHGFCDLLLEPLLSKYPDAPYQYLIEFKYIKCSEKADSERIKKELTEAQGQLFQYAKDSRFQNKKSGPKLRLLSLVFHGWELKEMQESIHN